MWLSCSPSEWTEECPDVARLLWAEKERVTNPAGGAYLEMLDVAHLISAEDMFIQILLVGGGAGVLFWLYLEMLASNIFLTPFALKFG